MGEMRDSDWSRENLLRSDWLLLIGAIMTTWANVSDAMRTRGTIFLVKSKWLVKNIEKKQL